MAERDYFWEKGWLLRFSAAFRSTGEPVKVTALKETRKHVVTMVLQANEPLHDSRLIN